MCYPQQPDHLPQHLGPHDELPGPGLRVEGVVVEGGAQGVAELMGQQLGRGGPLVRVL